MSLETDIHGIRFRGGLARQRADYVVGLVAGEFENRNAISLEGPPYVGHLLYQIAGHLAAVGLVAVIFNFLESLGLQIKLAHRGEGFRLGVAEGGGSHIKDRRQILGREVIAQFTQHVDEDVRGRGGHAGLGGHSALPRHGVVGAEDERHGVDQEDAPTVSSSQLGRRGRRRAFHLDGQDSLLEARLKFSRTALESSQI